MEIIILSDIEKLGDKHEIVTVKPGYARNFLIPQGHAIVANVSNRRSLAHLIRQEDAAAAKHMGEYQDILTKVQAVTLKIGAKTGTSGKIFGSVNNVQIAAAIKDQIGVEIERKRISIPVEVKELGEYEAIIELHKQVKGPVKFEVVSE